ADGAGDGLPWCEAAAEMPAVALWSSPVSVVGRVPVVAARATPPAAVAMMTAAALTVGSFITAVLSIWVLRWLGGQVPARASDSDAPRPRNPSHQESTHPGNAPGQDGHGAARASVGDRRAARQAGYRPAQAPMASVARIPPTVAQAGMTEGQSW